LLLTRYALERPATPPWRYSIINIMALMILITGRVITVINVAKLRNLIARSAPQDRA
jgi:hypothetical protein